VILPAFIRNTVSDKPIKLRDKEVHGGGLWYVGLQHVVRALAALCTSHARAECVDKEWGRFFFSLDGTAHG
jgi:hypothetical protein